MNFVILSLRGGGGLRKTNLSFLYLSFSGGGGRGWTKDARSHSFYRCFFLRRPSNGNTGTHTLSFIYKDVYTWIFCIIKKKLTNFTFAGAYSYLGSAPGSGPPCWSRGHCTRRLHWATCSSHPQHEVNTLHKCRWCIQDSAMLSLLS